MKWLKIALGILALLGLALAVYFVLQSEHALLTHPKGLIAQKELDLIVTMILLMLIIVVPTFVVLFTVAWRYRAKNAKVKRDPEHTHSIFSELLLWIAPASIVTGLSIITWYAAHELDPFKPLKSDVKPLTIQVVAIDWKWLFIYPEQGIATVNYIQFPEKTPINFRLAADGSPMNSFWMPQLSGQIYCMTGMVTPLHIIADGTGTYAGRAAEINGRGLADMTFTAQSTTQAEFDGWVEQVKQSPLQLDTNAYNELLLPSINHPVTLYSYVEEDLFNKIVMKYMHPMH